MSEGTPQDALHLFEVLETLGVNQPLSSPLLVQKLIPLFSGELALFLPTSLGGVNWSSRERTLSGHLVESLACGFAIHL